MQTHCEQITRIEQPERRVFDAPDLRGLVLTNLVDVKTGIPGGILEFLVPPSNVRTISRFGFRG
jgi:hypothetical protein